MIKSVDLIKFKFVYLHEPVHIRNIRKTRKIETADFCTFTQTLVPEGAARLGRRSNIIFIKGSVQAGGKAASPSLGKWPQRPPT